MRWKSRRSWLQAARFQIHYLQALELQSVCGKFILCVMAHGLSKTQPLFWGSNAPQNVWTSCLGATLGFMPFGVGYFEVKNLRMSLASLVYGCGLNIISRQCYRVGLLWQTCNFKPPTEHSCKQYSRAVISRKKRNSRAPLKSKYKISFGWRNSRGDWFVFVWQPKMINDLLNLVFWQI